MMTSVGHYSKEGRQADDKGSSHTVLPDTA